MEREHKRVGSVALVLLGVGVVILAADAATGRQRLGLPPVPVPADNQITLAKVALGQKLFEDKRLSATGEVSCATCHDRAKAFTDHRKTSLGIRQRASLRNAPTLINAAFNTTQFGDGRSPSLEDQALHPFLNPVEMGLESHAPVLQLVRTDDVYVEAFKVAFGKTDTAITMKEVIQAIATFERTLIAGNSAFDRYYFGQQKSVLTAAQKRGLRVFRNKGRCVSCHVIEQTTALFTDHQFHNIGVGIHNIQNDLPRLVGEFLKTKRTMAEIDINVLSDAKTSELGRLAVTRSFEDIGAFKTPTLRNVAFTAPYMHDGSIKTLREAVVHHNNGGVTRKGDKVNAYLSGGIRPLALTKQEIDDLVSFMEALTSPMVTRGAKRGN